MTDLTDRINAQIRYCQGRIERATFKLEHDEWREVLRLLEDIRDEFTRLSAYERILTTSAQGINTTSQAVIDSSLQGYMGQPLKRGPGRPRKEPQPPEAA